MDQPLATDADPAADARSQRGAARADARARAVSWGAAGLCAALAALAYRELWWFAPDEKLAKLVEDFFFIPSQSVAPLVVALCGWLVYRRNAALAELRGTPRAPGLGASLVGLGAALHLWAGATRAFDLLAPSLGLVALGLAALWRGRAAVRALLLPALVLLFAMPLPAPLLNQVVYVLQLATADLSGALLALLRVPHTVQGDQILRTQQTFSVIENCSGLRSIETLTLVAILMVDLFRRRGPHAWLLVLAAPPVALFLNGWRAVALILNPHSEIVAIHNLQGVAILLGGLVLLFLFDGALARAGLDRPWRAGGAPAEAPPGGAGWGDFPLRVALGVFGALALLAAVGPRFALPTPEPLGLSERIRAGIGDLYTTELDVDWTFLGRAGFRESASRRFHRAGHPVDAFVGIGFRPGRAKSPLTPKSAMPGTGWILERSEAVTLPPDGRSVQSFLYRSATLWMLVYHWYEGSGSFGTEVLRNALGLDASPLRAPTEIVAVRLMTDVELPIASGLGPANERLAAFYAELRPTLDRLEPLLQTAGGKTFPDLSRWESIFHPKGVLGIERPLSNQALELASALGMRLANPFRWDRGGSSVPARDARSRGPAGMGRGFDDSRS